jgi:hypothetical protein
MPYWVTKRIDNFLDELEEEDDEWLDRKN